MKARAFLLAVVAALPVAVACNSASANPAPSASAGAQQLTVKGLDTLRFEPSSLTAKAGQPIQLTFDNTGQILHDFTLKEGAGKPVVILEDGGKTDSATFTIQQPGTYRFVCSQPGHEAAGMFGTLTIE